VFLAKRLYLFYCVECFNDRLVCVPKLKGLRQRKRKPEECYLAEPACFLCATGRLGLAEMARVARPGTPILVVDEQLDPAYRTSPLHRLVFRALTFYASDSASPVGHLPPGATDVVSEQVSRYYYGLTFRMPPPGM
jgi:hypothetical protein